MSNLYSILPSLTPSTQDILEAELLAKQILEAKFPDLDLREGTGLRDLILRPTSYIMALLKLATDSYFAQNTISGVNDTTDTEIVDDILSNWFIERHLGTTAVISARLYFARSKNITIPSSAYFSTDNSLKFYPSSTQTFTSSSLSYDSYQNEWYVDIELTAESSGTDYNIGSGSLLYFSSFDPYFLHAEINYLSQSSTSAETNSEFIARTKTAVSTRNLINVPSVLANLQDTFNVLDSITTVGMGDEDMIRDQIKVVIDPEDTRTASDLSRVSTTATLRLPLHGFENGQVVKIWNALPSGFNGTFTILSHDLDTFTYAVADGLGVVTRLPYVQSVTAPTLVHTGGMVDVYCGTDVSTELTQVTTNSSGVATLVGPIYEISRSELTGGTEDDTIPFVNTVSINTPTIDLPGKFLNVLCAANHNLVNGDTLNVSGIVQTKPITSLACTNLVVTVVCPTHELTTGDFTTISGVTPTTYNGTFSVTVIDANTFTYILSANVLTAGTGTTKIITNANINGTFQTVYTGLTTFKVILPKLWTTPTPSLTGLTITHPVKYTVTSASKVSKELSSLSGVGTTATATLSSHGFAKNRYVTISNATPAYYNGTWKIREIISPHQFTFDVTSTITAPATGTISAQYIVPWKDVGFSSRQEMYIDFGIGYANQTASFETKYFTYVNAVQSYFDSTDTHVLCGDYLARGYNLYVLDVDVVTYNSTTPTSGSASTALSTYLKSLAPGGVLVVSDMVGALNAAGITNIQTPLGVSFTYYHRDLVTPKTGIVLDYLDPLDKTNMFVLGKVSTSSLNV